MSVQSDMADTADIADVVIVGAGASGAAAAFALAQAGLNIVCLEQGDWPTPSAYPSTGLDWEMRKSRDASPIPNVRQGRGDYPIDCSTSPIDVANFNGVGGSTVLYSAHFPRFKPSDFCTKSLDGVGEDWPISYADLEPYFAKNDAMMGVAGLDGDPAYPPIDGLMPPIPPGRLGHTLARGFNALGWHWWPSYAAIATRARDGRAACLNLGPCNTGCPQGAKASVDVTYWPRALKLGVDLRVNAAVVRVLTEDGRAVGVVYRQDGQEHTLRAKCVALAANAVGTARVLLASAHEGHAEGLANQSGLVGRNLMLHPLGYVEAVFDHDLQTDRGPQGASIYSHEFYETRPEHAFKRGYTLHVLRGSGPVETAVAGLSRRQLRLGETLHQDMARIYNRKAFMSVICEDLPEASNRVVLDEGRTDGFGMPGVRVDYALGDNSKAMLTHGLDRGKQLMRAAGGKKIMAFGPVRETGWHLMGTARMGTDPRRSVVRATGEAHDVAGLFVLDGSVFPTSSGVNPASTIQAVSLLICDHIIGQFAGGRYAQVERGRQAA